MMPQAGCDEVIIFTKHDVTLVVVDLAQTEEDDGGQEERGLTEILSGDGALTGVGGHQAPQQEAAGQPGEAEVGVESHHLVRPQVVSLGQAGQK